MALTGYLTLMMMAAAMNNGLTAASAGLHAIICPSTQRDNPHHYLTPRFFYRPLDPDFQSTLFFKVSNETQNIGGNQWLGLILSVSTTGLLRYVRGVYHFMLVLKDAIKTMYYKISSNGNCTSSALTVNVQLPIC